MTLNDDKRSTPWEEPGHCRECGKEVWSVSECFFGPNGWPTCTACCQRGIFKVPDALKDTMLGKLGFREY
jgi:hypothetical protein